MARVKSPSDTVLLADGKGRQTVGSEPTGPYGDYIYSYQVCCDDNGPYQTIGCHNNLVNIAWVDGHASALNYGQIQPSSCVSHWDLD
jgi:prepilin-type processing-associated H-X9-DG protein